MTVSTTIVGQAVGRARSLAHEASVQRWAGLELRSARLRWLYLLALVGWLVTRLFVIVHQGAWPWMNAWVVDTAEAMLAGSWTEAVRPPLPALLATPLLRAGADEATTILVLYLLASLVQFGAFALFTRQAFWGRHLEQGLSLLLFLLIPINHSIHHWRNIPVVLASSGTFLLAAHWLWTLRQGTDSRAWSLRPAGWALGALAVGILSRAEVAVFAIVLAALGVLIYRGRVWRTAALYVVLASLAFGAVGLAPRLAGADPTESARYQVHTFLDSTPSAWLSPQCRDYPTENCREDDGWQYFGPRDASVGLATIIARHPLTALAKTWRSALDNLWELFGRNISTYPGSLWLGVLLPLLSTRARAALRAVAPGPWMVAAAVLSVSVLPPLSWAPPHPQYHLHSLAAVAVLVVPLLAALWRQAGTRRLVLAYLAANALLSAFRYTRYPGY